MEILSVRRLHRRLAVEISFRRGILVWPPKKQNMIENTMATHFMAKRISRIAAPTSCNQREKKITIADETNNTAEGPKTSDEACVTCVFHPDYTGIYDTSFTFCITRVLGTLNFPKYITQILYPSTLVTIHQSVPRS